MRKTLGEMTSKEMEDSIIASKNRTAEYQKQIAESNKRMAAFDCKPDNIRTHNFAHGGTKGWVIGGIATLAIMGVLGTYAIKNKKHTIELENKIAEQQLALKNFTSPGDYSAIIADLNNTKSYAEKLKKLNAALDKKVKELAPYQQKFNDLSGLYLTSTQKISDLEERLKASVSKEEKASIDKQLTAEQKEKSRIEGLYETLANEFNNYKKEDVAREAGYKNDISGLTAKVSGLTVKIKTREEQIALLKLQIREYGIKVFDVQEKTRTAVEKYNENELVKRENKLIPEGSLKYRNMTAPTPNANVSSGRNSQIIEDREKAFESQQQVYDAVAQGYRQRIQGMLGAGKEADVNRIMGVLNLPDGTTGKVIFVNPEITNPQNK